MYTHFQFLNLPNIFSFASLWYVSLYLYSGKIPCLEVIFTYILGVIPDVYVLFAYYIFFYLFFLKIIFVLIFKFWFLVYSYLYSICATVTMLNSTLDIWKIMMIF